MFTVEQRKFQMYTKNHKFDYGKFQSTAEEINAEVQNFR